MSQDFEEVLIGGVASTWLQKEYFQMPSFAVYATNKRLMGVEIGKAGAKTLLKYGMIDAPLLGYVKSAATAESCCPTTLQELDRSKKAFEIGREQISRIEIRKPGTSKAGHLCILAKSGSEIQIAIGGKKECESLISLLEAFLPGAVAILE